MSSGRLKKNHDIRDLNNDETLTRQGRGKRGKCFQKKNDTCNGTWKEHSPLEKVKDALCVQETILHGIYGHPVLPAVLDYLSKDICIATTMEDRDSVSLWGKRAFSFPDQNNKNIFFQVKDWTSLLAAYL